MTGKYERLSLATVLLVAALLRWVYPLDFEYKYDQIYLFERSQKVGVSEPWPTLGMPSSVGTANPGLSVWIFPVLARLTGTQTPEGLTWAQIALNLLALVILALGVCRLVPPDRREPWLWATALAAVNVSQVLYDRVLWQQSALPIFSVALMACVLRRSTPWGSLGLGLLGLVIGQIHLPGFFYFAGLMASLVLIDRKSLRWGWWAGGIVIAMIPMLPWIQYFLSQDQAPRGLGADRIGAGLAFLSFWWISALGVGLEHRLGVQWREFLAYPASTQGVGVLQGACTLLGIIAVIQVLRRMSCRWKAQGVYEAFFPKSHRDEAILFYGGLLAFGGFLALSGFRVYAHYLMAAFPITFLSVTVAPS